MLFNSIEFWVFFIPVLIGVHVLPHRGQNRLLLLASYIFYGAWDWRFLGLIFASTIVDYIAAQFAGPDNSASVRKRAVAASVIFNLGVLAVFKYFDFFIGSFAQLFGIEPSASNALLLNVVLPVGISFYTFQTLSYTLDVNRGKLKPVKRFEDVALYVAFFPQLVAGPIERAAHFMPQITANRRFDTKVIEPALMLILWGLFKKIVIADGIGPSVDLIFATPEPVAMEVYAAAILFGFQIYCDFSGYSDIARGLARLMGFELILNFNLPYIARNPSDYWRRWHISLSSWLRDYLYIPLGGNRFGALLTYRNLFLTMLLGGLWHGAAWNYILWGGYHGVLLAVHRFYSRGLDDKPRDHKPYGRMGIAWRIILMNHAVLISWLLFRARSLDEVTAMFAGLLDFSTLGEGAAMLAYHLPILLPLIAMKTAQAQSGELELLHRLWWPVKAVLVGLLLGGIIMLNQSGDTPFIYFQF